MHYDAEHEVVVTQRHRAITETIDTYELNSDRYTEFLQIDEYDHFAREEFILDHATFLSSETDTVDLLETIDVTVEDIG